MNRFSLFLVCLLGTASTLMTCAAERPAAERPNIVFVMADDLGYGHLGCYGQRKIRTPHLDQMAAEGTRFTQVYAGHCVCAPSRSVLMTGKHTGHTSVRANGGGAPLLPEDVTVAEVLKDASYATGGTPPWSQAIRWGKWKAIRHKPRVPLELYDLTQDVGETADVADEHPDVIRQIEESLRTARSVSRTYPAEEPSWGYHRLETGYVK